MKNITTILFSLLIITSAFAQTPQKMSYQAVIRDAGSNLVRNANIGIQVSILQDDAAGNAVYTERHSPATNSNGLVTLEIGTGTVINGDFSTIDWADGTCFIKTEIDLNGGENYTISSVSQLLSVPYALHAKTAENVDDADADPVNEIQTLSLNGSLLELSNNGGSVTLPNTSKWDDGTYGISHKDSHVGIGTDATISTSLTVMNTNSTAIFAGNNNAEDAPFQAYNQNANGAAAWFRNKIRIEDGTEGEGKVLTSDINGFTSWSNRVWWEGPDGIVEREGQVIIGDGSYTTTTILSSHTNKNLSAIIAKNNGSSPTISVSNEGSGLVADFAGRIRIYDDTRGEGKVLTSDAYGVGSWQTPSNNNYWTKTGDSLSYNGAVGIGTTNISGGIYKLTMGGNIHMLNHSVDYISQLHFNDNLRFNEEGNDNYLIFKYGNSGNGGIKIYDGNNYCQGIICSDGDNAYPSFGLKDGAGYWAIQVRKGQYTRFLFSDSEKMRIESNGNVGIGTSSPDANLHLIGNIKIVDGTQSDGKVLTSDADGLASWVTPAWIVNGSNVYRSSGNVGIGTTTPVAPLEIKSNANPALIIGSATAGSSIRPGIQFKNNTSQWIAGDDGSDEIFGFYSIWSSERTYNAKLRVYGNTASSWGKYIEFTHDGTDGFVSTDAGDIDITPAGNVGVKTNAPTQTLDVNGNMRVRNIASGAYYGPVNRTSDGTLTTASSDIRLKENIHTLDNSLDKIMKLRGVTFTWKTNPEYGTRIGFVAQEFEKVIPELSFTNPVDGYKGINYAEVTAVLVEAVKAQQKQIEALKAENKQLKDEKSSFESRLEKLENMMTGMAIR